MMVFRFLYAAASVIIAAFFLALASGRFLLLGHRSSGPLLLLAGTASVLLCAAFVFFIHTARTRRRDRLPLYLICALLVGGVQLTGGQNSVFYFTYMLFLVWVSLPSVEGSASELGLVIGAVEGLALLNAFAWPGEGPFISRMIPLLLPGLQSLLVPFISGLAADWLSETEFRCPGTSPPESSGHAPEPEPEYRQPHPRGFGALLRILHRNSGASSTCLFVGNGTGPFRLAELVCDDGGVMPGSTLNSEHRLARLSRRGPEPVLIMAGSSEERKELSPYRVGEYDPEEPLWILVCRVGSDDGQESFLLQDFTGTEPSSSIVNDLRDLSETFSGAGQKALPADGDSIAWMAMLAERCASDTLEGSLESIVRVLTDMIPGATVSIADVDRSSRKTRILLSRGPLSRRRRGRVFESDAGIAGWIVKNGVPCRRSRLRQGGRNVCCFSSGYGAGSEAGSVMGVPVSGENDSMKLIMVEHESDQAFGRGHESFLTAVSGLLSMREEIDGLRQSFSSISGRDSLTGLPGISLLDRHLHQMAREVQTYGWCVGVLAADIDGFGSMNERIGYSECDRLLSTVANRFSECFSDDVFLARTGPDSFAACIPRTGKAVMEAMCLRVADALAFEFETGKEDLPVSASVGGAYTHVNRKVVLLTGHAEKAAAEAFAQAPGSCLVRNMEGSSRSGS